MGTSGGPEDVDGQEERDSGNIYTYYTDVRGRH